jgi:predicted Fe-Mo cluster-binding NifX family protein
MKIAISATGSELSAQVDSRFGRCQYFIIVDPETMRFEAIANKGVTSGGGAGIAAAQQIAGKGLEAVLTGNCGPNAFDVLAAAGIKVFTDVSGSIEEAVNSYKAGNLESSAQPNVSAHAGMGRSERKK